MSVAEVARQAPARWLPVGIGAAAVAALYAPVMTAMAAEWAQFPNLSHGFAIPLIAGYLVWARRDRLLATTPGSWPLGLALVVVGLGTLVIASLSDEPFFARISLPVTLLGAVGFLAGPAVARLVWVPIAYLLFMIPLPYVTLKALTYQSRLFDATVTTQALRWLGIPVLQEGVLLHLANMTLEVADECSSIPAIAALVALGGAYAQLAPRPTWARVLLTVAAVPLGLLSNFVRLVITSASVYYFGRIALDNAVHKFNGTTVFLLTVLLLVVLDSFVGRLAHRR